MVKVIGTTYKASGFYLDSNNESHPFEFTTPERNALKAKEYVAKTYDCKKANIILKIIGDKKEATFAEPNFDDVVNAIESEFNVERQ